ncbi:14475_t:CDS:2 [Ambispora leptoticha]|uniref:very-long-chain enoyl-CoA reductase n=1 Tax=Ambispora leptoticha TaxID=144679 RepID=A0A9N8Z1N8_9GLOM|nr:14475_t:CDS:2 [Ambispora leptoticha]
MKITISPRSGKSQKFPIILDVPSDAKVNQVKQAIHKKLPKYYPDRQRLTFDNKLLEEDKTLAEYGIRDGDTVLFKDLGLQIGWRTVFIIEYFGPLVIHPIFYYFSTEIYGKSFEHSKMQTITYYLVLIHFMKREFETIFIHRFSNGTMPFLNIFKNSGHYYLLSGFNLAYWVYGPWNAKGTAGGEREEWYIWTCVGIWIWAQLSNLSTHVTLRNLRPPGTRVRKIPHGYGFELVSCPNYFFEVVGWVAIAALTKSAAALFFVVFGGGIMYAWAVKKHKNYRKEFKDYPKNRKSMFPFIA